jgi:hypothetical protein
MTEQEQIQAIVNSLQALADRLSMEGRLLDAAQAVAGLQTIRALYTRLQPPKPVEAEEPVKEPHRLESV